VLLIGSIYLKNTTVMDNAAILTGKQPEPMATPLTKIIMEPSKWLHLTFRFLALARRTCPKSWE